MNILIALGIAAAGAAGSLSRWGLDLGIQKVFSALTKKFPGTAIALVNVIGGFAAGVAAAAIASPSLKLLVITGFLGGFTTFSTAMMDIVKVFGQRRFVWAIVLAAGTLAVTILASWVGIRLGNTLLW